MKVLRLLDVNHIIEELDSLVACCDEAISDEWDKSDEGFEAMIECLENLKKLIQ